MAWTLSGHFTGMLVLLCIISGGFWTQYHEVEPEFLQRVYLISASAVSGYLRAKILTDWAHVLHTETAV